MTPTRSQLDAALPRVPSGIGAMSGDLTDDDDRAVALDWLERLYVRAILPELEQRQAELNAEVQSVTESFVDDHDWTDEQIDGVRTTIEWLRSLRQSPPPAPGPVPPNAGQKIRQSKPAPGITYHGRDDER